LKKNKFSNRKEKGRERKEVLPGEVTLVYSSAMYQRAHGGGKPNTNAQIRKWICRESSGQKLFYYWNQEKFGIPKYVHVSESPKNGEDGGI